MVLVPSEEGVGYGPVYGSGGGEAGVAVEEADGTQHGDDRSGVGGGAHRSHLESVLCQEPPDLSRVDAARQDGEVGVRGKGGGVG